MAIDPAKFILALLLAAAPAPALAADADHGETLARRWCAACHIATPDQKTGGDSAPAFAAIAQKPGMTARKLAFFLLDPHPKMPDMGLSRRDAEDLAAYISGMKR
jgi:mono/diheme cytochrome c family protein